MELRAEELNLARERLLDRAVNYFLVKKGVESIYIQGSVAAGLIDEFSDIDLRVIIQPELYEQYVSERFSAPKYWGEWLYNEWTENFWVCVSHFKPLNKIDVFYFKPEHLQSSPWYLLPTQVIYDPNNLVQQAISASAGMEFILDAEEVERLISKGLAYAEEVYRRVIRDELFYAQSLLDGFRAILMRIDDNFRKSPSPSDSASHFEQRGSQALIEILQDSYTPLNRQLMLHALSKLLKIYQNQVLKLHAVLSMERDRESDLYCIDTILEGCNLYSRLDRI